MIRILLKLSYCSPSPGLYTARKFEANILGFVSVRAVDILFLATEVSREKNLSAPVCILDIP